MDISRAELVHIAADTQQLFERRAVPHDLLMGLFMAHLPKAQQHEAETCRWVQKTTRQFPKDNCILASLLLNHRLDGQGEMVEGLHPDANILHALLDVGMVEGEQTAVDITGHQFRRGLRRGSKLHVGSYPEGWIRVKRHLPLKFPLPVHERHVVL